MRTTLRIAAFFITAACMLLLSGPLRADEGCPSGQLPSYVPGVCKFPSQYTQLPLVDHEPMRFEAVQVSMTIIYHQAIGLITEDTPRAFEEFLLTEDARYSKDLVLHSSGGSLLAAVQLGQLIRKAGLNTSVGRSDPLEGITDVYRYPVAYCYSACTYAFLGGVTRSFADAELFGVHRFGLADGQISGDDAQVISAILARYIGDMGVDPSFLVAATSASFQGEVTLLTVDDARRMRVVFDPSGRTTFHVEDSNGSAVAFFEFLNREETIRGLLLCADASPSLVLFDHAESFPTQLHAMDNFPSMFSTNGRELSATGTYVAAAGSAPGYVVFRIPGLTAGSFAGTGLSLESIDNPMLDSVVRDPADGSDLPPELLDRMFWQDGVSAFWFAIVADNGERTLPLVLRGCS